MQKPIPTSRQLTESRLWATCFWENTYQMQQVLSSLRTTVCYKLKVAEIHAFIKKTKQKKPQLHSQVKFCTASRTHPERSFYMIITIGFYHSKLKMQKREVRADLAVIFT